MIRLLRVLATLLILGGCCTSAYAQFGTGRIVMVPPAIPPPGVPLIDPIFVNSGGVNATTHTSADKPFSLFSGVTAPQTFYAKAWSNVDLTSAGALVRGAGFQSYYKFAPTDSDAAGVTRIAMSSYFETGGSQNLSSWPYAFRGRAMHLGTGTLPNIVGGWFDVYNGHAGEQNTTGGNITTMTGFNVGVFGQSSSHTIGTQYGMITLIENDYGAGVTDAYGHYSYFAGGVIPTNSYAYYAGTVKGANKYAFYAADVTASNFFAGPVAFGANDVSNAAVGTAGGFKMARGATAFDGSNPTTVATGLATVTSCTATLRRSTALTSGTAFVTHDAPSGANVDFYAWVLAGTASTGTETFDWVCIGT